MEYLLPVALLMLILGLKITITNFNGSPSNEAHAALDHYENQIRMGKTDHHSVIRMRSHLRCLYRLQHVKPELPIVETVENLDLYSGNSESLLNAILQLKSHLELIDKELK